MQLLIWFLGFWLCFMIASVVVYVVDRLFGWSKDDSPGGVDDK